MLGPRVLRLVDDAVGEIMVDLDKAPSIRTLVKRMTGAPPRVADIASEGALARVRGEWRVFVRRGMSPERQRWVAAHELGHWWWEHEMGYSGSDLEARCDALGAALVAPAAIVRASTAKHSGDVVAIARDLKTTQSVALLRLGEVLGEPVALLRRRRSTIIRGRFVSWPVPLSWQPAKAANDLVRVHITDEPGRFGVKRWEPR